MKVVVKLEFNSEAEAAQYLAGKTQQSVDPVQASPAVQQYAPAQASTPVAAPVEAALTGLEKARATKAANKAAKDAVAKAAVPQTSVPTTAFPTQPSQPINPLSGMPAAPQGVPMPSGMPAPANNYGPSGMPAPANNYGPPMQQQQPAQPAPQQQYHAPVQQAPVAPAQQAAPQAWNRDAVINGVQTFAENSGLPKETIKSIFGSIFQEQQIVPAPVGQLSDQDLYKFQGSFYQKMAQYGNPNHLA